MLSMTARPLACKPSTAILSLSTSQEIVSEETALAYASHRSVVSRGVDSIKGARGEKTTDIEGLSLDKDYEKRIR